MKWTKEYEKKLKDLIMDDRFDNVSFGSHAIYIPIDEDKRIAVKMFMNKKNRDFSQKLQRLAHKNGIGPEVGEEFAINMIVFNYSSEDGLKDAYKRQIYGYMTEIADTIDNTGKKYTIEQKANLMARMEELGMSTDDLFDRNLSVINGKLICVDFDLESHANGEYKA